MNQIDALFRAASNQMTNTLEKGLQSLVKLFQNQELILTTRDAYYSALINLRESVLFNQSAGLATVLLPQYLSTATMVDRAKTDISFRYALQELNPFVVAGDTGLYAQHNQDHSLDVYDPSTGVGSMTEQYFKDRAAFLVEAIKANAADNVPVSGAIPIAGNIVFDDVRTGYKLGNFVFSSAHREYFFGDDIAETITGGVLADHLYGGNGDDTIQGGDGDDYLQGDAGADELFGDKNDDTLLGMAGDDKLDGGEGIDSLQGGLGNDELKGGDGAYLDLLYGGDGDDTLIGGQGDDSLFGGNGNDTYKYTTGDGRDTIKDIDGLGTILFDGQAVNGGNTTQNFKKVSLLVRVDYIRTQRRDLSLRTGF